MNKRREILTACRLGVITVTVVAALITGTTGLNAARGPRAACSPWTRIPTPDHRGGEISDLAKVSADDIWAVGSDDNGHALAERWNGMSWQIVPTPRAPAGTDGGFSSVTVVGPDDVWAVGSAKTQGLIERWNGRRWRIVAEPALVSGASTYISSVSAVSAHDIWAVGNTGGLGPDQFILHWNGKHWRLLPSSRRVNDFLYDVQAINAHDVWAVGLGGLDNSQPLVEHWDGRRWSTVSTPPFHNTDFAEFDAIAAVGPNDIWAVGDAEGNPLPFSIVEHWNGQTWSVVASHTPSSGLWDVSAFGSGDIWAVGDTWQPIGGGASEMDRPMTEHWNGKRWSVIPLKVTPDSTDSAVLAVSKGKAMLAGGGYSRAATALWNGHAWARVRTPNPISGTNELNGVAASSPSNIWAIGSQENADYAWIQPTSMRWDGSSWHAEPTATPSFSYFGYTLSSVATVPGGGSWAVGLNAVAYAGYVARSLRPHVPEPAIHPLTEWWNETKWTVVKQPLGGEKDYELNAVSALSRNQAWAVGAQGFGTLYPGPHSPSAGLVEARRGGAWVVEATPIVAGKSALNGVAAVSARSVWAVGWQSAASGTAALIEHFNGSSWSIVPSPTVPRWAELSSVASVGHGDLWAVGRAAGVPLLERWNGKGWFHVRAPLPRGAIKGSVELEGVSGSGPHDVWAAGYFQPADHSSAERTLIEHWNGSRWSIVGEKSPSEGPGQLSAVTSVKGAGTWAVGAFNRGKGLINLSEQTAGCRR